MSKSCDPTGSARVTSAGRRRERCRFKLLPAAFAALVAFTAAPTRAYRTFQDDPEVGNPAAWAGRDISWDVHFPDAAGGRASSDELVGAFERSVLALAAIPDCSPPSMTVDATNHHRAAGGDGRNTIEVVTEDWVGRGLPSGRGATTDVQIRLGSDNYAEIVEADIYLNYAAYEFVGGGASGSVLDLQAVLTHELLHALGLLHNCEHELHETAPLCGSEHTASAVYPTYLGESARTLSSDDIEGLCFLYEDGCEAPCAAGSICIRAACVPDSTICSTDADCVRSGVCARAGERRGTCTQPRASGSPCASGDDCDSLLCVTGHGRSYCTVRCEYDDQCSGMQTCAQFDDRRACAPLPDGGCSVGPQSKQPSRAPSWFALLALAIALRRRKVTQNDA